MTEAQWKALRNLNGFNMVHPEYGLIVGKIAINNQGEERFVITFKTDLPELKYGYVLWEDTGMSDDTLYHLRAVYDMYLKSNKR